MHICMLGVKGIPLPAGIDNVVEQVGSRLVARGHRVTVFVRPHYTPRERREWKGMCLVHVPSIPTKGLDAITSTFFAVLRALALRPDLVHIHSTGLSVFAPLTRIFGLPTLVQSHGLDWQRAKWQGFARSFLKFSDYTTVRWPDASTAVSRKLTRYYRERYGRPVVYIPNGAPPVDPRPPAELEPFGLSPRGYLLFAARLVPEKWCHGLVEAYRSLPYPKLPLVIAGDGSYNDPYAANLKSLAGPDVRFLGFVTGDPMRALLSHAYAYILPSEIEGLSTGLIEAMAYGNCVLVSDIEENLEVLGPDGGLSFRTGDVASLHSALARLLADPDLVARYRALAQARACSEYDWERVTDNFETLYAALLARAPLPSFD